MQAGFIIIIEMFQEFKFIIPKDTPVTVIREIFFVEIALIALLELFFVVLPLPNFKCFGSRQHINNILFLKVKWFFSLQCLFQIIAIFSFTNLPSLFDKLKFLEKLPLSTISFLLLKLFVHYFGYRRIKYLDDGRDFVSFKEFISVHCTFSVLNSWMTYFLCYNLFVYLNGLLKDTSKNILVLDDYMAIVAMILMAFESSIYLAYYKDAIFSFVTLLNYIGMYFFNFDPRNKKKTQTDGVEKCQISLIVILSFFIVVTVLHDFDKVFYL